MKNTYTIVWKSVCLWAAAIFAAGMCVDLLHVLLTDQYAAYKEYCALAAGSGLLALFPLIAWELESHVGWMLLIPTGLVTVIECFFAPKAIISWINFGLFCILLLFLAARMREGTALFWKVLTVFVVLFGLSVIILPMWQRIHDWNVAGRLSYEGANRFVIRYFMRAICQRGLFLCSMGSLILGMRPVRKINEWEDEQDQFDRIWE